MKLVIFDIDGTLTDTQKVEDRLFMEAFEETFGIDITDQSWEDFRHVTDWGITEEILIQEYGETPTMEDYQLLKEIFVKKLFEERATNINQFKAVNGATPFFNHLQDKKNVGVGIATGSWEESALIKLEAIGIDPTNIPFSNSSYHKTREEITRHTIKQATGKYQQSFEDVIYFGDGKWDYMTCQNLGIQFIGIDILQDGRLKGIGAEVVFENFIDVEAILEVIGLSSQQINGE